MTGIQINAVDPVALAANSAFTGTYAPLGSVLASVYLPAQVFVAVTGTPVVGEASTNDIGGYLFDAAATEIVFGMAQIPTGWNTYNTELWWVNAGAGSGNVVWRLDYSTGFGDGEAVNPGTAGTQRTVAAPAGTTAEVTAMDSGITSPTTGELVPFRLRRIGGDAADTLANDACVLGVRLVKAS